ncbi:DUF6434 domain-containing protein [Clostridium manihotivorum]|uniref:SAP domain-containing protein n=1 Tax=Clostridium manihotivorum TaxID=2320868 RepID=A0A410DT22_9CLOT|nr:DUF6434 domain-containing protein [Clostridium manihotivorum]QAA32264.1 hypothetical protein C1I91_11780 [Clostridium manihotivorum]
MSERPVLSKELKPDTFLQYYYLKEELVSFCKENGLSATGGKQDITKRIEHFLRTGEKLVSRIVKRKNADLNYHKLALDNTIEENFVCSEKHRVFFKSVIGNNFSFNVTFQKYLKSSAGKTYSDAVKEWYKIQEDKKKNKGNSPIDNQFEYNTYIRDFFKNNGDKTLKDAIKCWKFKKGLAGHNKYEKQDLSVLEK